MIEVENLSKIYQQKKAIHKVLTNINLQVDQGEIFGIIGKSGAGKSTLLKCLNLLEIPDAGKVKIDGVDLTAINSLEIRALRRQIGVIFQHFNLLDSKTIFENVAVPLVFHGGYSKAMIKDAVAKILELVGLTEFATKYPAHLSGGQKQRVGIARALINQPKILLCDEATSALDAETTSSILQLLLDINQQFNITIVLITHELEVVRKICDKIAVIDKGIIVEQGKALDILLHPKHLVTRSLIIEEETEKFLEQVSAYYNFGRNQNAHILLLSFIGEQTYQPILNTISRKTNTNFSILRGKLGLIKRTPFGQLLVEFEGAPESLSEALKILQEFNVHYEIIL